MDQFHEIINEVKSLVENEILNKDTLPEYMSEKQLYFILDELKKMDRIRNSKLFFPYYPKGIVDDWDYSNQLTEKLLEVLEVYRKL